MALCRSIGPAVPNLWYMYPRHTEAVAKGHKKEIGFFFLNCKEK